MRWILILILKESQTEALHDLQYKETNKLYGTSVCNKMCSKCNRFFLYKGNKIYYVTTANIDNKYFSCHQKYIIILNNKIYTKLDDNWKTNTQFCV